MPFYRSPIHKRCKAAADSLSAEIIRKRLDYWTLVLGPKFSKKDRAAVLLRRDYSLNQVQYCRNFIFRRNSPIRKIFERSCELGVFRLTAEKITQIFGVRKHKRIRGKLHSMLEKLDHGHHVLRAPGDLRQPAQRSWLEQRVGEFAGPTPEVADGERPLGWL